jgi:hypothetical protein
MSESSNCNACNACTQNVGNIEASIKREWQEGCFFQEEFRRLLNQLEVLKEKNILLGNQELVNKLAAMLDASSRVEAQVSTIRAISSSIVQLNDLNRSAMEETNLGQIRQEEERSGRR